MAAQPVSFDESFEAEKKDSLGSPHQDTNNEVKVETNQEYSNLGFWTRMGCTPESFKRRNPVDKSNQLNQTLRSRHMHMIAIGMFLSLGLTDKHILISIQVVRLAPACSLARDPLSAEVARPRSCSTTVSLVS